MINEPLVFVDVETTGANATRGRIIEVAAIRYENGKIVNTVHTLLNPNMPLPHIITNITGIRSQDLVDAPVFSDIADDLWNILDGAVFVAHNVRFDYSFIMQEFMRVSKNFSPKMLCTVRLSRALYPEFPRHRLSDLIANHGFTFSDRHRAYDDAHVLVQFWEKLHKDNDNESINLALSKQLRSPSIPRHLDQDIIYALPERPGVYFFRDSEGIPLYIGKSINIKKRVLSHFNRDSSENKEFSISQSIRSVDYEETGSELAALLRESYLIKKHIPVYNRKLRRVRKLMILEKVTTPEGYYSIVKRELSAESLPSVENILAIFERRMGAKKSLEEAIAIFKLCPILCNLEKSRGACFRYQLGLCKGACIGKESPESYNSRVMNAYSDKTIAKWPYSSQVVMSEHSPHGPNIGFIVDRWVIRAKVEQDDDNQPIVTPYNDEFDHDAYRILRSFMLRHPQKLRVAPYSPEQFEDFL